MAKENFNEPSLRAPFETFYGRNIEQMPLLVKDGREPVSVSEVMERRINSKNLAWKSNYFGTGDMIAYHPDGRVKVVLDAKQLREITPETSLVDGALTLANGVYETLNGAEFKRTEAIFDKDLTPEGAKINPFWQYVARGNGVLVSYVDTMFPEMKSQFEFDEAMGIYLLSAPKQPQARALYVGRLVSRSRLGGGDRLDGDDGRLVGVAPEARGKLDQLVVEPTLEQAVARVNREMGSLGLRLGK